MPKVIREDLADALARLDQGHTLAMPLSRPMSTIGKSVHELRLKDHSGIYRIIYMFIKHDDIWLLHAFKKTTQETPNQNIRLAKKRIRELI